MPNNTPQQASQKKSKYRNRTSWKKGQSGNPSGMAKAKRADREYIKKKLDEALTQGDRDLLVEATVEGVAKLDPTCMKLAYNYRFGAPATQVDVDVNKVVSVKQLSDEQLLRIASGEQPEVVLQ